MRANMVSSGERATGRTMGAALLGGWHCVVPGSARLGMGIASGAGYKTVHLRQ